jgi:hypothetical protein
MKSKLKFLHIVSWLGLILIMFFFLIFGLPTRTESAWWIMAHSPCVIHKEGLCPSSFDINRLMMMIIWFVYYIFIDWHLWVEKTSLINWSALPFSCASCVPLSCLQVFLESLTVNTNIYYYVLFTIGIR